VFVDSPEQLERAGAEMRILLQVRRVGDHDRS
jgi:hypothetical protein